MKKLDRSGDAMNDPLFRFLDREVTVVSSLLKLVQSNLTELRNFVEAKIPATNVLRNLAKDIYSDVVPNNWKKYIIINIGLNDWILDFKKRLDQFDFLSHTQDYCIIYKFNNLIELKGVWFGGLIFPEAFLTATR